MIKKVYTFAVICFSMFITSINAQTVQVVVNPGTSGNIVTGAAAYHASESVYLASEIGTTNFLTAATAINHIDFNLNTVGTSATSFTKYTLYLKEVAATVTTLPTAKYSNAGYTSVFTGTFNAATTGWVGVDLTTPFTRTSGSKNLQLLIVRADGVTPAGFVWTASVGSTKSATDSTTRRYNGTTTPKASSTLAASLFREAVQFRHLSNTDASLTNITFPTSSCYNSTQSVSVTISNSGKTTSINAGQASVALSVSGANTFTGTLANVGSIAVGSTEVVTFSGINLNNVGLNNFKAIVSFTGDGDATNDTITGTLNTASTLTTLPIIEDAEAPATFVNTTALTGTRSLWGWYAASYINPDMNTSVGTTDSLTAHGGSHYYLLDTYSGANSTGFTSILYSQCITFPSGTYGIGFWITHDTLFQTSLDSIFVDVSTDKGVTWNRVQGFQRVDQSGNFDSQIGWQQNSVDLSAYAGQTIQIAFEGQSAYGNVIGLDDISIYSTPLPVKYLSFKGNRLNGKNKLTWVTANEINNKGFEVESSVDGVRFNKIGYVASTFNGFTSTYTFTDPQTDNRVSFYRLKQIDKNGKSSISPIVEIKSTEAASLQLATIYPNPVNSELNLKISALNADKLSIIITDVAGKSVYQNHASVVEGLNFFEYNLNNLKAGTYYLRVIGTQGATQTQVFEKK